MPNRRSRDSADWRVSVKFSTNTQPGMEMHMNTAPNSLQKLVATAVFALALPMTAAHAGTVFSDNFESGNAASNWSGVTSVLSTQGLSAYGFGNWHLFNNTQSASTLSLSGLGTHTEMTLNFSLALWDSVDIGSDRFVIKVDDTTLYDSIDFGNYYDSISHGPGTHITPVFTDHWAPNLGYSAWRDSAQTVSYTFAHTGSSANISFQYPNTQGGYDEAFGLDNVTVSVNAIPEPETYAMMMAGLGLLGFAVRRRKQNAA
jgi:hypothetical protein